MIKLHICLSSEVMYTALNMDYWFMSWIYGALPAHSFIKNGSNIMKDVDKMEHDIFKVNFIAHSLNNGDIQWRNRRGGRGGRVPPQRLLTGKFLMTYREKRGK